MSWRPFSSGDARGSEGGVIVSDEEHEAGARITLERDTAYGVPAAITCGLYGRMMHTRFFSDLEKGRGEYAAMKAELERILALDGQEAVAAIDAFVERYP